MSSDFLKGAVSGLTKVIELIEKLIKHLGTLGTIGLGAGIFGLIKSGGLTTFFKTFSILSPLISDADTLGGKIKNLGTVIGDAGRAAKKSMGGFTGLATGIGLAISALSLLYNWYKNNKEEQAAQRQETIDSANAFLDAADSFEIAYIKYADKTSLTAEEEADLEAAIKGTVDALGDKSSALQDAVNSGQDYLTILETIKQKELEEAKNQAKEKNEKAKESLKETVKGWTSADGSEVDIDTTNLSDFIKDSSGNLITASGIMHKIAKEYGFFHEWESTRGDLYISGLELPSDSSADKIVKYYEMLVKIKQELKDEGFEGTTSYKRVETTIKQMQGAVETYKDSVVDFKVADYKFNKGIPKTLEEYIKYRKGILKQFTDFESKKEAAVTLDNQYGGVFDLSSDEFQIQKFAEMIKGYGDGSIDGKDLDGDGIADTGNEIRTTETFLNMRTALNNNECTVGQYLDAFDDVKAMQEGWTNEEKEYFNTSLGLDTDKVKEQYDDIIQTFKRNVDWNSTYDGVFQYLKSGILPSNVVIPREVEKLFEFEEYLNSLTATEFQALVNLTPKIDWKNDSLDTIIKQVEEEARLIEAMNFEVSIEVDKTALETLNEILAESASAMGLSSEAIDSLQAKYSDLDGYNPSTLFEKTANGVKVNRQELEKLEKEYNNLTKSEVQEHLDTLVDKYNDVTAEIDKCSNASERAELLAERETYADKIEELATYQAQLEGVTGAYQDWINAQNTPEDYEGYEAVATNREDIKEEIDRGFIGNSTKKYIDLLSGEDLDGKSVDDYAEAWEKLDKKVTGAGYSINDFFTVNDDGDITAQGIDRFFKSLQTDFKGSVAKFNEETKEWEYDFGAENLEKIKEKYGIGIEAIELLLEAAASAGYDIDWGGILDDIDLDTSSFETLVSAAEAAQTAYNKIEGLEDVHFNFTATGVKEAESEIEKARNAFSKFINEDGTVNLKAEGAEEMQFILTTLIIQKQQLSTPAIMKVDTSQIDKAETKIIDVVNKAQTLQTAYENYEIAISTGVDVEGAKKDLNSAITALEGTDAQIRADLKLPTNDELQAAAGSLGSIKVGATLDGTAVGDLATKIQTECTPEIIAKVTGIDESAITNGEGGRQVKYTPEHSEVDAYINGLTDINKKIIFKYTTEGTKPNPNNIERTITYEYKTKGEKPKAYGTAYSNGSTSGRAFARGNWGIKGNGTALGGELAPELLIRDGNWHLIGEKGAEFFQYRHNDIIFNAAQTESLFKYGGIKGAKPRGTMLATGSAFAGGNAQLSGRAFAWTATGSDSSFAQNRVTGETYGDEDKSKDKDFEEVLDWIKVIIDRVERSIDKFDQQANNIYKSWSSRNTALQNQISEVNREISLQQQAKSEYMSAADGVKLDESWAKKVRNGEIDIDTIKDETLAEKIKSYQKYYEQALDCERAVEELKEKESSLYKQRFENVQAQYDGILQGYEHTETMLNEYISQAEAQGHIVSENYYNALIDNEKANIAKLRQEQSALIAERDKAVASGKITKGSQAWYEMCAEIDSVTQAIEEGNTALIEYNNSIRDIEWEQFDLIQERISDITAESEFLKELLSNKDLYDDEGNLTEQGRATIGLHALDYNKSMYAVDNYQNEIDEINKQIAQAPYDQGLINRRRELVEAQREQILAAEDYKNSIKSLLEDAYSQELDYLQEKIDKTNEAIDSQKD